MSIKPRRSATILPKSYMAYDPETFGELELPNFKEATAEEVIANLRPCTFDFLPGRKFISVDTETYAYANIPSNRLPGYVIRRWIERNSGKYIPNDFPFCMSICDGTNAYVVYDTIENKFAEFKKLMVILQDASIDKIAHNIGFDMHMIANAGVDMKGRLHDTMILSKLTRADALLHNLLEISKEDDEAVVVFELMLSSYKSQYKITDYRHFPRRLMTQYTCADVWNAIRAFKRLYPAMLANNQLKLYEIESEMLVVAYSMECEGILLDPAYKDILIPELQAECDEAEKQVYDEAGMVFNMNSGQQLFSVLTKLGYGNLVKISRPTDTMIAKGQYTGNPCFDKDEMARLDDLGVPLISKIQTFKASQKLLNTFAIKIYEMCDADNIVHCNINTVKAKTGRFSISNPSMQNMPRRKDSRIRDAFIAPEEFTLYDFDFKAQESLILSHYSRAPYLLDIINSGGDIHKAIAAVIYNIPMDKVDKKLRDISKSVEFAIIYGAGPAKVHMMTGLTVDEAKLAMSTFLRNVPEVDIFIRTVNKVAKERGCIRTILNRIVYVDKGVEYASVNYACQGSGADSTKSRMVVIHKYLKGNNYKTRMLLQVHDSLLNKVHNSEKHIVGRLRWLQTERELFRVTVTVDVAECDRTWRNKHDVNIPAEEPTPEEFANMNNYDIWAEGLLSSRKRV